MSVWWKSKFVFASGKMMKIACACVCVCVCVCVVVVVVVVVVGECEVEIDLRGKLQKGRVVGECDGANRFSYEVDIDLRGEEVVGVCDLEIDLRGELQRERSLGVMWISKFVWRENGENGVCVFCCCYCCCC